MLVAVYPPHSTHRLQPLDVGLFAPLGIYYSQELDKFIHQSQGICSVTKRDFFRLFWGAYVKAFTQSNIDSAWRKTGLHPIDPSVVLSIFNRQLDQHQTEPRPPSSSGSSNLSASEWRKIKSLVKEAMSEQDERQVQKLTNTILAITTENAILKAQNTGYVAALNNEKQRRKRGKHLFKEFRAQDGQGATFFSPAKIQSAKDPLAEREETKQLQVADKRHKAGARRAAAHMKRLAVEAAKVEQLQQADERKEHGVAPARLKQQAQEEKQTNLQLQQLLAASAKKPQRPIKQSLIVRLPIVLNKSTLDVPVVGGAVSTGSRVRHLPQRFKT